MQENLRRMSRGTPLVHTPRALCRNQGMVPTQGPERHCTHVQSAAMDTGMRSQRTITTWHHTARSHSRISARTHNHDHACGAEQRRDDDHEGDVSATGERQLRDAVHILDSQRIAALAVHGSRGDQTIRVGCFPDHRYRAASWSSSGFSNGPSLMSRFPTLRPAHRSPHAGRPSCASQRPRRHRH